MKLIRAISLAVTMLVPVAAFASPTVRQAVSCCPCDCCDNCSCPDCDGNCDKCPDCPNHH